MYKRISLLKVIAFMFFLLAIIWAFCGIRNTVRKYKLNTNLYYDTISKRYFESTLPNVLSAETELQHNCERFGVVSLNEYFVSIGLKDTKYGDEQVFICEDNESFNFQYEFDKENRTDIYIIKIIPNQKVKDLPLEFE